MIRMKEMGMLMVKKMFMDKCLILVSAVMMACCAPALVQAQGANMLTKGNTVVVKPVPEPQNEKLNMKYMTSVFYIENHNGIDEDCKGTLVFSHFNFEDDTIGLIPELKMYNSGGYKKNGGGRIVLTGFDGRECMSFPVNRDESVKAEMIGTNQQRCFLLVKTYRDAANGSTSLSNWWLVGRSGDKFVIYATRETLDKAGLVYDNIVPKVHDGQLEIMGIARMYGVGVNGERGPLGEKYRGKKIRALDPWTCTVNSVYFFWDEKAQWFGFRLVE